jgi:ATP-dependent DNA ligase
VLPAPPIEPMLATLARELPVGDVVYEPKWDGFRCLAFRDGEEVDLRSRNQRAFSRYFPEVVEALLALECQRFVIDGELVAQDFPSLLARTHPAASRVAKLATETPATFIAFDVLAVDGDDLRDEPFVARRRALEQLLRAAPPTVSVTPMTDDAGTAAEWLDAVHPGIDGVVVKQRDLRYLPGKRAMVKVKHEHTVDCVVAGAQTDTHGVSSLLLGVHDGDELVHVGVAAGFARARKRELVCEVAYDHLEGVRFRHPARFKRWRPDRDARSCTVEQLR